jgi:hypothetical protein
MDDLSVQEWLDLFKNKDIFKDENMLIMRPFSRHWWCGNLFPIVWALWQSMGIL